MIKDTQRAKRGDHHFPKKSPMAAMIAADAQIAFRKGRYQLGTANGSSGSLNHAASPMRLTTPKVNTPRLRMVTTFGLRWDGNEDLSHLFTRFKPILSLRGFFKSIRSIDGGFQFALEDQIHHCGEIIIRAHGRSNDGKVFPKNEPVVNLIFRTPGVAHGEHSSSSSQCA